MENNTKEVVKEENKVVDVKAFLNNHNLTKKAQFLYKNGFHDEMFQEEKLLGYVDVTHNNGFKGFSVYTKNESLFIAKPETDEEDNIFSYNVIELTKTTDEEYANLKKISETEDKTSLSFILKIVFLIFSIIGTILGVLNIITLSFSMGFLDTLPFTLTSIFGIACVAGISALLFKKK